MAGRLGIGAHHTIDVLGAVGIVGATALVASALPLPAAWNRPLLPPRWRASATSRWPVAHHDPSI